MTVVAQDADAEALRSGPNPVISGRRTAFQHSMIYVFVAVPMVALVRGGSAGVGVGGGLARPRPARVVLRARRAGHHGRLPPPLHAQVVQGQDVAAGRDGDQRVAGRAGQRPQLGGRPPPPPRVLRPRRATRTRRGCTAPRRWRWPRASCTPTWRWFFDRDETNHRRFIPDLLADRAIVGVSRTFGIWVAVSLLLPAVLGGLITWSWAGVLTGFFWGGLVRLAVLEPRHVVDQLDLPHDRRPSHSGRGTGRATSGRSRCCRWASPGTTCHHADPTCARHGVLPGQVDISARLIWIFEKLGWAHDVRWPTTRRLARLHRAG